MEKQNIFPDASILWKVLQSLNQLMTIISKGRLCKNPENSTGWNDRNFNGFEPVYPVFPVSGPKRALFWARRGIQDRSENANLATTRKPQMKIRMPWGCGLGMLRHNCWNRLYFWIAIFGSRRSCLPFLSEIKNSINVSDAFSTSVSVLAGRLSANWS